VPKRILVTVCVIIGALFLVELAIPGHFALLEQYFNGVGELIGVQFK